MASVLDAECVARAHAIITNNLAAKEQRRRLRYRVAACASCHRMSVPVVVAEAGSCATSFCSLVCYSQCKKNH